MSHKRPQIIVEWCSDDVDATHHLQILAFRIMHALAMSAVNVISLRMYRKEGSQLDFFTITLFANDGSRRKVEGYLTSHDPRRLEEQILKTVCAAEENPNIEVRTLPPPRRSG